MKYIYLMIAAVLLSACGDDDNRVLSPCDVFSSSAPASSAPSVSSSSMPASVSSESSSSEYAPAYIAPDFLVATSSRLFRGYLQDGIPRIELFASNRHVINPGCRYSIDSSGIIFDHRNNTHWDSGIRDNICHMGIYYYKYHDAIYIITMTGDYRVPINGAAVKIVDRSRSWYLDSGYSAWSQIPRATDYSIIVGSYHYLHDGTRKQAYEINDLWYHPAFLYRGNPHESDLLWQRSGKYTRLKCGTYAYSTTNTISEGDLQTDQIKIGSTWYLGSGATFTADGYTAPTNPQRTPRKFALHDDGNYMYWYDSEADHVVRNSTSAPNTFSNVDLWQWGENYDSTRTPDELMALRMNPMSLVRFENGYWSHIDRFGNMLLKNVLTCERRTVMTNVAGALIVNIKPDRFHGERGY